MSIEPPRPKPPPLGALRAFEAAARLGSFARAAEELFVTPSAVSQQIKLLEEWAGGPLFQRKAKGIRPSALGARIYPGVTAAFDQLGQTAQMLQSHAQDRLHIAALPSVAQLWLSPRLPKVRRAFPEVEISVTALEAPPNLLRDPFGLSIFYRDGGSGMALEQDEIFPVCAPEVAEGLLRPIDVLDLPCLSDSAWGDDWDIWLRQVMPKVPATVRGPSYSLYALAVAEAENGAGVLMGHKALVQGHLDSGRLVRPFAESVLLPRYLYAEMPPKGSDGLARDVLRMLRG